MAYRTKFCTVPDGLFEPCRKGTKVKTAPVPKGSVSRWQLSQYFVSLPDTYQEFTIFVIQLLSKSEALYKPCATFKGRFQNPRILFPCNDGLGHQGRYVYIRDDRRDQDYFSLCEVEVFTHRGTYVCLLVQFVYGLCPILCAVLPLKNVCATRLRHDDVTRTAVLLCEVTRGTCRTPRNMITFYSVANRVEFTWSRNSNWMWRAVGRPYLWVHLLCMLLLLEDWRYATEAGWPRVQKWPRKSCGHSDYKELLPAASIWAVCDLIWCLLTAVGFPPGGSGQYSCTQMEDNNSIHGEKQYTEQYRNTEHAR